MTFSISIISMQIVAKEEKQLVWEKLVFRCNSRKEKNSYIPSLHWNSLKSVGRGGGHLAAAESNFDTATKFDINRTQLTCGRFFPLYVGKKFKTKKQQQKKNKQTKLSCVGLCEWTIKLVVLMRDWMLHAPFTVVPIDPVRSPRVDAIPDTLTTSAIDQMTCLLFNWKQMQLVTCRFFLLLNSPQWQLSRKLRLNAGFYAKCIQ